MGGSAHSPRQDTANSNHQTATNQLPTSTYSDPLLPTHSADNTNLHHYQPTGVAHQPSSPSGLALDQRDSSGDGSGEKLSPILQKQDVPVRTAEVTLVAEESELNADRSSSPPAEPQSEQPCLSRLTLFSGMQLVTKGRSLCGRETSQTETDDSLNLAVCNSISKTSDDAPLFCNSDSSQPVSAFSFLNF